MIKRGSGEAEIDLAFFQQLDHFLDGCRRSLKDAEAYLWVSFAKGPKRGRNTPQRICGQVDAAALQPSQIRHLLPPLIEDVKRGLDLFQKGFAEGV
ncbi:hypothetical protein D3C73_1513810 [compost metagenome]